MGNGLARAREPRSQLHTGGAHLEIACNELAAPDTASNEDQVVRSKARQNFLRQNGCRDGTDVAASLHALDHERIRAGAKQLLAQCQGWREADDLGAARLDRFDASLWRDTACQNDMADTALRADVDQVEQLRMHGDEIDTEGLGRERLRADDLRIEQVGRHRAAGNDAEAAGIADRRDEIALRHPRHRAAQDRIFAAEKLAAPRHQRRGLGVSGHRSSHSRLNETMRHRTAGRARQAVSTVWIEIQELAGFSRANYEQCRHRRVPHKLQ